jgi:hypothetical protein
MFARGTRRFVEQIDDLLRAAQAQQVAPTQNSGVADFRVFYLRYAWAQDTTMAVGGRQVVMPGVASILRSLVGAYQYAPIGREVLLKPTLPSLKGKGLAGQACRTRKASARRPKPATMPSTCWSPRWRAPPRQPKRRSNSSRPRCPKACRFTSRPTRA